MRPFALSIVLFALFTMTGQTAFAQTFSVQGVLRDPLGKTVDDGSYSMTFRLYEQATGGTAIWEETQGSVQVLHGVFGAELGTVTSLSGTPFNTTYWLGISIDGGQELEPRFKLTKSPSSLSVVGTDNVFPSKGNIGAGTVTPTAALHIVADPAVTNDLLIEDASNNPKLVVNDNNQVGVGVSSPEALLQIRGTDDTQKKLLIEGSDGSDYVVVTQDGKMGVGVSAPTHPLAVNGNLRLQNGGAIVFDDGTTIASADFDGSATSVTSPGNALVTADADKDNTGEVQLVTGTTTRMVVTNDGNVGIGTDNPDNKLDVVGTLDVSGTSYLNGITLDNDADISGADQIIGYNDLLLYGDNSGGPDIYITSGGNVGIGTTGPSYKLHVNGSVYGTSFSGSGASLTSLNASNITTGTISDSRLESTINRTSFVASGQIQALKFVDDNSTYYADLNSGANLGGDWIFNGKVGIGTSASDGLLNLDYNRAILLRASSSYYGGFRWDYAGSETMIFGAKNTGTKMMFAIGHDITANQGESDQLPSNPEMTIADGRVGLGTKTPSAMLHIKQPSSGNAIRIEDDGDSDYWEVYIPSGDDNLNWEYNGTVVAFIRRDNGTWNTISDIRLKESITDLEPVMDKLMRVGTYRFKLADQEEEQIGFIAQDLEQYFPEFVSENEGYKGVNYAQLTPVLVKAIKELKARLDEKDAEVEALKAENVELRSAISDLLRRVEALENR